MGRERPCRCAAVAPSHPVRLRSQLLSMSALAVVHQRVHQARSPPPFAPLGCGTIRPPQPNWLWCKRAAGGTRPSALVLTPIARMRMQEVAWMHLPGTRPFEEQANVCALPPRGKSALPAAPLSSAVHPRTRPGQAIRLLASAVAKHLVNRDLVVRKCPGAAGQVHAPNAPGALVHHAAQAAWAL